MHEVHSHHICHIFSIQVDILHVCTCSQIVKNVDKLLNIGQCQAILILARNLVVGRPFPFVDDVGFCESTVMIPLKDDTLQK